MSLIEESSGISPVIGVVLLVGLTVALVSVSTVVVFNTGTDSFSTNSNSEVKLVEKGGYMEATVLEKNNDFEFKFIPPRGSYVELNDVGDKAKLYRGNGKYTVVGNSSDGTENIISQSVGTNVFNNSDRNTLNITYLNSETDSKIDNTDVHSKIYTINKNVSDGNVSYELINGTYVGDFSADGYKDNETEITVDEKLEEFDLYLTPKNTNVSGTVSINPTLEDALVEAKLDSGTTVTNNTDSNGNYKISESPSDIKSISVYINGNDTNENDNYVYASAKKTNIESSNIDFEFTNTVHKTIDGQTVEIAYKSTNTNTKTISNAHQLQVIGSDLSGNYKLVRDIDASVTSSWNNNNGFKPIGSYTGDPFKGIIDGQNHKITGLDINRGSESYTGLISYMKSATIKNLTVKGSNIKGNSNVGGLVGVSDGSILQNVTYKNSVVKSSGQNTGGIIGRNLAASGNSEWNNIRYSGEVNNTMNGANRTGGISGYNNDGGLYTKMQFSGVIESNGSRVGGLIGYSDSSGSNIKRSYSQYTINLQGTNDDIGGIVGNNSGVINKSYSIGDINNGEDKIGGIVGVTSGEINNTYSDTTVNSGVKDIGGIAGSNNGAKISGYWHESGDFGGETVSDGSLNGGQANSFTSVSDMKGSSAQSNMNTLDIGTTPSGSTWVTVLSSDSDSTSDYFPILVSIDRTTQLEDGGVSN